MKLLKLIEELSELAKDVGPAAAADIEVLCNPTAGAWPPMPAKILSVVPWEVNNTRYVLVLPIVPEG